MWEIDINFPFKYTLFTNNHILDELNIEIGNIIHFEYLDFKKNIIYWKEIKIKEKRKVFTNKELM